MKSVILGTAGHIDHGKTSLVRALTGIDCDRLPEEKARGITIELGFAHLTVGDVRFGIVDVPGHEKFVRAMVAGAGGMDLVMLVIAADEGVMPQTREHLDICSLLAVPRGLVVLTKSDLVDADWVSLVTEDIRRATSGTFLEGAAILPVSSTTGAGLDDLKRELVALAEHAPPRDPQGLLRLPLDRVFTIKGFGTVVTGTLVSGRVREGDDVVLLPSGVTAKVRGVEVHDETAVEAVAGQRTAVNLQGPERADVERGEVLVQPNTLRASSILDGHLRYLRVCRRPLKSRTRVLFHTGTTQAMATCILLDGTELGPGESEIIQLHLESPVVALPKDRFILRGFETQENYGTTLGGGEIVRVLSPKLRRGDPEAVARLRHMHAAALEERVALEIAAAGVRGLDRSGLLERLPYLPRAVDRALEKLSSTQGVVRFDRDRHGYVHADAAHDVARSVLSLVDHFHVEQPLRAAVPREELRSKLTDDVPQRLFHWVVEHLLTKGELAGDRETVRRAGHRPSEAAVALAPLKSRVAERLRQAGVSPPREAELVDLLRADSRNVAEALRLLVEEGVATRVADLTFDRSTVDQLRVRLVTFLKTHGSISPQAWKEICSTTRKFSIPLAEHFDAEKLTVRVGEGRKLRGR